MQERTSLIFEVKQVNQATEPEALHEGCYQKHHRLVQEVSSRHIVPTGKIHDH
jgi:hypothetical protein